MNKRTQVIIAVVVLAIGGYLLWKYIRNRGGEGTGTGALGTNLNSVAPELVGGSAGPNIGPAVSTPINITLTEQIPADQSSGRSPYANQANNQAAVPAMNSSGQRAKSPGVTQGVNPVTQMKPLSNSQNKLHAQTRAAKSGKVQHGVRTMTNDRAKPKAA